MATDETVWREASVTYPDWQGNAQLDQRMTGRGLEEIVGLDPEQWSIVGIDIGGGEHAHELRVVAFPRDASREGPELEVTEFLAHDVDPYDVLREMTHVFELKMRARSVLGKTVRIKSWSDLPEQD